jgi:hypothetical protein
MQMEMFLNVKTEEVDPASDHNSRSAESNLVIDNQNEETFKRITNSQESVDGSKSINPSIISESDGNEYHYVPEFIDDILTFLTDKCRFESTAIIRNSKFSPEERRQKHAE